MKCRYNIICCSAQERILRGQRPSYVPFLVLPPYHKNWDTTTILSGVQEQAD
jgi:hypothetical protein